jgi:two-component system sensor histidine kinase BaeS
MIKNLWVKFLVLLLAVSAIALSSAFFLRDLMIRDFREYLEGEMEDRVYWVLADLENTYGKHGDWKKDEIQEDAVWALMLGLETKILDMNGRLVMDTARAIDSLAPLMKRRMSALSGYRAPKKAAGFIPHPIFLGGKEIGRLEVRFLRPTKETIFIQRSNRFLLGSIFALGGLAFILSVIFSRRLTRPIKKLAGAAEAISEGQLKSRVAVPGRDEISRLADSFNRMAQSLERQESLRKKLISNVAHELRTPLAAIRGEMEGMMDGLIPRGQEQLLSLYEEVGRLKNILQGIEDLAQAEASSLTIKRQTIHLAPFLNNIVERLDQLFLTKGVSLELRCPEELRVSGDPKKLSQIVVNLLSNALKATEGGGRVWIEATRRPTEIVIEVGDSGCGIKPEDLPLIFERFYKASEGGLGLGLTIVKELVEAHGGKIEVRSEWGKGSAFIVHIPSDHLHNSS